MMGELWVEQLVFGLIGELWLVRLVFGLVVLVLVLLWLLCNECSKNANNGEKKGVQKQKDGTQKQELSADSSVLSIEEVPGPSTMVPDDDVYWEPKHNIFLSHSGVQKDFTRFLCEHLVDVHHTPFLDVNADSLPKGEKWFPSLMTAAQECRLAVLVISDDFFSRTKWPMIELNEFAKNPNAKILPLFLKMSFEEFDESRKKKKWLKTWQQWAKDDPRIKLDEWEKALSEIKKYGAMSYGNEGEPSFIKKVVVEICKLVKPDVKYDVPYNESFRQLCKPILLNLKELTPSPRYKVCVMGLYGVGGIGKTTISKAICNEKYKEYGGKACHIEFGSKSYEELRKLLLTDLAQVDATILNKNVGKLFELLKCRLKDQKIFLVLDNVKSLDVEEVLEYLKVLVVTVESTVVVTSRAEELLIQDLFMRRCDCYQMTQLDESGVSDVFYYYLGVPKFINKDIIKKYVNECCFEKKNSVGSCYGEKSKKHYLPLALKVLGTQLQRKWGEEKMDMEKFLERFLEKVRSEKFNIMREGKHPIFSVLRLGYDALCYEDQLIFLDLAILWTPQLRRRSFDSSDMWSWMCGIHRKKEVDMKESVGSCMRNGVLDLDGSKYIVHDLYIEFAKAEARKGPLERRRFLIDEDGSNVPIELLKNPSGQCWPCLERLIILNSRVDSLKKGKLHLCSNVEVLCLYNCEELIELDVHKLENLRSMEVIGCIKLDWSTFKVEELSNLVCISLINSGISMNLGGLGALTSLKKLIINDCEDLEELPISMTALQDLKDVNLNSCYRLKNLGGIGYLGSLKRLQISDCRTLENLPSDLSELKQLEYVNASFCYELKSLNGIEALIALKKLDISCCTSLEKPPSDLSKLKQLEDLDVSQCRRLKSLDGIEALIALKKLNISGCKSLKKAPSDLSKLKQLEDLDVSKCKNLKSLDGIEALSALKKLNISWCKSLEKLPSDLSKLKQLEDLDGSECERLKSLDGIEALIALKKLNISWCKNLEKLPSDLGELKQLEDLDVSKCERLKSLDSIEALTTLKKLDISCCTSLEKLPSDLSELKQLEDLDVSKCKKLKSLYGIEALIALKKLNISWCKSLEQLPSDLSNLKQLEDLDVSRCDELKSVECIEVLIALKKLDISCCTSLEKLPSNLSGLKQLEDLDVSECERLKSVECIEALTALKKLNISWCKSLEKLPSDLSKLKQLEDLDVSKCERLKSLDGIEALIALKKLNISWSESLEKLPSDLSKLKQLEDLDVLECERLKSLDGIEALIALKKLNISRCTSLEKLPSDLSQLKQLEDLDGSKCERLKSLDGIEALTALKKLNISWCQSLEELPTDLRKLKQLEDLDVLKCERLKSLDGIEALTALKKLNISWCKSLEKLPSDLSELKQLEYLNFLGCDRYEGLRVHSSRDYFEEIENVLVHEFGETTK